MAKSSAEWLAPGLVTRPTCATHASCVVSVGFRQCKGHNIGANLGAIIIPGRKLQRGPTVKYEVV